MDTIQRSAIVPYSCEEMFNLVNNIEDYPKFLPWCHESHVVAKSANHVEARLDIAWSGFHKSFTTKNTLHPHTAIEIDLVTGPFRHLEGKWHFNSLGDKGCKVALDLEFEFTGNFLDKLFDPIFNMIANSLVESFSKRAKEIYGEKYLR